MNSNDKNQKFSFLIDGSFFLITLPFRYLFGAKISFLMAKFKILVLAISALIIIVIFSLVVYNNNQFENQQNKKSQDSNYTNDGNIDPNLIGKVLDVPYFNQYLEPDGTRYPEDGWKMCGAASSTMIAGYFKKINYTSESDLKSYMYQDRGLNITRYCNQYGGTFGVTSKNAGCNFSTSEGINEYFNSIGLKTNQLKISFSSIKSEIDSGRPIIFSTTSPFDHIAVIKGYTNNGRLIMNDPFKDTQDGTRNTTYSVKGKNAIYSLDYPTLNINYLQSVFSN